MSNLEAGTANSKNSIALPYRTIDLPPAADIDAAIEQFAEHIEQVYGIRIEPKADGLIQRFHDPEGGSINLDCWCVMNEHGTHAAYGSWRRGEGTQHWNSTQSAFMPRETQLAMQEHIREKAEIATQEREVKRKEAARKARDLIAEANTAGPDHPYLIKKGIPAANAKQDGEDLLIPLQDVKGRVRNFQRISPTGEKRFPQHGQVHELFSLIEELPTEGILYVCEGWATAVTLRKEYCSPVAAAMNAGNLLSVCKALREALPATVTIIVAADDDRRTPGNPGRIKAAEAGKAINAQVRHPGFCCDDCGCTDFNDVAVCRMQGKSNKAAKAAPVQEPLHSSIAEPIPLVSTLPSVKPFVLSMLPDSIAGFVGDTSARLQVSPDYLAVGALAVIAGIVGSKRRIRPKQQDTWTVTPVIWAAMIGNPSSMKSPSLNAVLQPVYAIEKELTKAHENALAFHSCASELAEENLKSVKKEAAKKFKDDQAAGVKMVHDATFSSKPPVRQRYILNDATVEKCGELLGENPTGMLLVRDELSGFLDKVSREEYQGDRAFYLECFEGNNPYTYDRIGRGTTVIKNCVLSMIGGIQPTRIAPLIRSTMDGTFDDGFLQRIQLAAWPDEQKVWKYTDRAPDEKAAAEYARVIREMHELPRPAEDQDPVPMRFSPEAQLLFIEWMEQLHAKIRSGDLHPVMQAHLLKMQKTIPTLALLFELADGGLDNVGVKSTARALEWADYLESHAIRIYSLASNRAMDAAKLILRRQDKLQGPFNARQIQRAGWAGLSSGQDVTDALELLVDHRYLSESTTLPGSSGGRPKTEYVWHPALTRKS